MALAGIAVMLTCATIGGAASKPQVVRVGYFPNVTHAQALIARHWSRQGKGWLEQRLGTNVEVQWFSYNAGPSAMEAFFANSLDLTYVGPNPALNAYFRSKGKEVRVIAGAAQGGSALVVQKEINQPEDLRGKRILTPQFGNTQDVACRVWLREHGFKLSLSGGDAQVLPTANPEQLDLFRRKNAAGVWTVEPWVSRLELQADGKLLLEEKEAVTTILTVRAKFLATNRDLVKKYVAAHQELTQWIKDHPQEAQDQVRAELGEQMRREFPAEILQRAWSRLKYVTEVPEKQLEQLVAEAQKVGFLKDAISLKGLVESP